jgi:acylphosphatase
MNVVRQVTIRGRVQGVGFRAWTEDLALRLNLEGWVRNRRDGVVEVVFTGPEENVAEAIEACRAGPRSARVEGVDVQEGDAGLLQRRRGERFAVLETA